MYGLPVALAHYQQQLAPQQSQGSKWQCSSSRKQAAQGLTAYSRRTLDPSESCGHFQKCRW